MNSRWIRCMISILMDLRLALEPVIFSVTTGYEQQRIRGGWIGVGRVLINRMTWVRTREEGGASTPSGTLTSKLTPKRWRQCTRWQEMPPRPYTNTTVVRNTAPCSSAPASGTKASREAPTSAPNIHNREVTKRVLWVSSGNCPCTRIGDQLRSATI